MKFEKRVLGFLFLIQIILIAGKNEKKFKKKSAMDLSDADIEKIYEEWEENDPEKLPEDELPPHLQKSTNSQINLNDLQNLNPEKIKTMSKKGKTLMMFVSVSGNPSKDETDKITSLWQTSLFNANYEINRFLVDENRAIFMVKDGSLAYEIKDFLVKQERCLEVTIDNEQFPGLNFKPKKTDL